MTTSQQQAIDTHTATAQREALQLATGALQALARSTNAVGDSLTFTGKWAHFDTVTIKQVLDYADFALGCELTPEAPR